MSHGLQRSHHSRVLILLTLLSRLCFPGKLLLVRQTLHTDIMDLTFVQEILEEINGDGPELTEESLGFSEQETVSEESTEFNELVSEVLQEMLADAGLTPLHEHIRKSQEQVPQLCATLGFVCACQPKKGVKKSPSVMEKAWGRFHHDLLANLTDITRATGNTQVTSFLSLKLFERILNPVPVHEPTATLNEFSEEELDIISYIGGSIVSKIKTFARRCQATEQLQYLNVTQELIATEESGAENTALIDCYDRGGLTRVKPQISLMFIAMEETFVNMFHSATTLSNKAFIKECAAHDDILYGFYMTIYDCEVEDSVKDDILKRMLNLFFTVRVHQKCRVYMDQVRNRTRESKKQKALRQKLKPKTLP